MTNLPIPAGAFSQHTIALGKTRAGKSSKLRLIVEHLLDKKSPVCVIDPKGDWWGLKSSADGKQAGYPVIIFGGEHADVPINEHSGSAVAELIATGNRPCIIDLGGWMVGQRTRFFIDFASTLFRLTKGARHLVIDECHNFAPQGRIMDPDSGKMLHWANRLASEGAGKGVTLISASQRPQKVHKDYVTSHETLIACRVIHPLDRSAIKEWIDGCADPQIGKDVMAALAGLQRSQAYVWSPEIGFGPKLVEFPLFSTYDSFKPQDARSPSSLKGWASVDLEDVKTKLATVVEEAKANDPKTLKAEIVRLTALLAKPAPAAVPVIDETKAAQERDRLFQSGVVHGRESAYPEGWLEGERTGFTRGVAAAHKEMSAALGQVAAVAYVAGVPPKKVPTAASPTPAPVAPAPVAVQRTAPIATPTVRLGDAQLRPAHQKILDALAWWESIGRAECDKTVLAFLADRGPDSSQYQNDLGSLRTGGFIDYPVPGSAALTAEGRANANRPTAPLTSAELQAAVGSKMRPAHRKIFDTLLQAYPSEMSRDALAEACERGASSSQFQNDLGRLRTLGVITYPRQGFVAAADSMFLGDR